MGWKPVVVAGAFALAVGCAEARQAPAPDAGACLVHVWADESGHPRCEPFDGCPELDELRCSIAVERCSLVSDALDCLVSPDGTETSARDGG